MFMDTPETEMPAPRDDLGEWLWPWPAQETKEFFESLGAGFAAAPGPGIGQATIKYILFSPADTSREAVCKELRVAARLRQRPRLTRKHTERIIVKDGRADGKAFTYAEVPIAITTLEVAKQEYGIDLERVETVLPQAERESGRMYRLDDSPDGLTVEPL